MYVEVELDKPRKLRFDLLALRDLQRRLGNKTLLEIANRIREVDIDVIMESYFVGLRHEDKDLTPMRVVELLQTKINNGTRTNELINILAEAFGTGAGLMQSGNGSGGDAGKA